jgi:ABC-type antimicrobial peptide transport system permease subunit
VAVGTVAAMALSHTLEALLYGVRPRDAASFAAAGAVLLAVTALAAFVPALRASRIDPANALRAD